MLTPASAGALGVFNPTARNTRPDCTIPEDWYARC